MKTKMPYDQALIIGQHFLGLLCSACQRIELAGSLRRKEPMIGDIEIVALPWFEPERDMFGLETGHKISCLDSQLDIVLPYPEKALIKNGSRYKQIYLPGDDITVDLFIQLRPETWGVNFALRTGSQDFSTWLVTKRRQGGACPSHLQVSDGLLLHESRIIPTLEESDFFEALQLKWIPPEEREKGRWHTWER